MEGARYEGKGGGGRIIKMAKEFLWYCFFFFSFFLSFVVVASLLLSYARAAPRTQSCKMFFCAHICNAVPKLDALYDHICKFALGKRNDKFLPPLIANHYVYLMPGFVFLNVSNSAANILLLALQNVLQHWPQAQRKGTHWSVRQSRVLLKWSFIL